MQLPQVNLKDRALADLAGHLDMAVALFNDPIDGEQSQAGAFVGFFGGKERLEDMGQGFRSMLRPSSVTAIWA